MKDPWEVPEFKCDYPLVASEEMGLISPGLENLLDFLESKPLVKLSPASVPRHQIKSQSFG